MIKLTRKQFQILIKETNQTNPKSIKTDYYKNKIYNFIAELKT